MPRIRTIKPEFWKNEDLSALPPETHMLAAALLNYADDEGYFNANPKLVKAECAPLREDSTNIRRSLDELARIDYIQLGADPETGKQYGRVVKFNEHQRVDRPKTSKIKPLTIAWKDSTKDRRSLAEPSSLEGKGREGKGKEQSVAQGATSNGQDADPVEQVFAHWKTTFDHPKAVLTAKRRKLIRTALADYTLDDVLTSLSGYLLSPHHMGENERKTRYDDIELFLRDAKHIEAGMQFAAAPPGNGQSPAARQRTIDDLARMFKIERQPNEPRAHFEERVTAANERRLQRMAGH